ncbi:hypothetical protein J3492_00470 [Psychrobacter sp. F1192]|uniref:SpaA-like prealbumin fold domain-containing protein n=1 Tax=Psychrobacter coccoides TaxID=2818440 RepID=A0ABS3NJV8_9GAMM|nr:hypothetical protein [Psychrobacter coccoides]MBO1529687.1 hypothetical protein [Psychrobacter coccoides]
MHDSSRTGLKKHTDIPPALSLAISTFLLIGVSLSSLHTYANPFLPSTPPTSPVGSCPANHKMYYIGANPPAYSPMNSQNFSWTNGNPSRTFTFVEASGNKTFLINFPLLLDLNNNYGGTPPFYGSINGATRSALNLVHNSPAARTNHSLDISINRPVSKVGYKIQDLDSTISSRLVPYIEQVDVSANNGQLTFNLSFHVTNRARDIVRARQGENCGAGECTIDAAWGYNIADVLLNLKHSNVYTQRNSPHAVGYSDFYFCLAPPKLIVQKQLDGNRVNDNNNNRDQFSISINNGAAAIETFVTTGTGQTVTNDNSGVVDLTANDTYTITERVINTQNDGDIANYNAAYICNNATTGSTTVMPTAEMTYDATAKTRSFTLTNATYGDEITCTITNSPSVPLVYTFSGIVFNDNGGITANDSTKQDISATFTGNSNYYNGVFDNNESGIFNSALRIRLTDCNGNNIVSTSPNPQPVSNVAASIGRYSFSVTPSALAGKSKVCLVQTEPNAWEYSEDTTVNTQETALTPNVYDYKTEKDSSGNVTRNLDFGEVKAANTALVLKKSQYIHTCDSTLNYLNIATTNQPTTGFSSNPASNVEPGNCIAYKLEAYNRSHVDLNEVKISDSLQRSPVESVFNLPKPLGNPSSVFRSTNTSAPIGENGTIISESFNLSKTPTDSTEPSQATLYFNTKYGAKNTAP